MAENLQSEAFNQEAFDMNANIPVSESANMLNNLALEDTPNMMDIAESSNVPPLVTVIDSEVKAASDKFKENSPVLAAGFDGGPQPKPTSSMAFAEGAGAQMIASEQWSSPTNYHMAGDRIYGANVDGRRFAKWYNHNEFDDVGFHPYRNNNDYYLQYTTGWDDFQTAANMELFSRGTIDQASSWVEWHKDTDPYAAQLFADQLDLMHSDRDGFWGSAANIFGSLQYSLGAITEFAAEEVALAALTTASRGSLSEFTLPRMGRNLVQLSRTLSTGSELMRTIKTVNRAKDFYQAARFAAVGTAKTLNAFANPFFRSTRLGLDAIKGVRAGKTMTAIAQGRTVFGEFFRDASAINMAMSESRLEGGMVQNDIINEVTKQKGNLTDQEINRLNELATTAGAATTKANAPIIFYTNKITLNNMFRGIGRASDRLLNIGTAIGGKAVRDGGKTVILETGFKAGLSRLNPFAKNSRLYYKHLLQTSPSRVKNMFIAGAPEGLQENYQEMISTGYKDYYTKLYLTPELAHSAGMRASFQKGLDEQFTAQGLETFISGFAIGGVMGKYGQALNFATQTAPAIVADKLGIDKTYSNVKKQRAEFKKDFMEVVAVMDTNPQAFFNMIDSDLAHQVSFSDFMMMGRNAGSAHSQLEAQDLALFKKLHTLFKSGQTDLLKDTLSEFLNLEDKDLQAAFPGVKLEAEGDNKSLRDRLTNSIEKVDMMKQSFEEAQSLKNHYNPWQYDQVKDKEKFEDEMYKYIAFEDVRFDMALMKTKLVTAQDYISEITARASKSKPLQSMSGIAFTNMMTRGGIATEVDLLAKERLVYAEAAATSDEAAKKLAEIDTELAHYKNYLATYDIVTDKLKSAAVDYAKNRDKIQRDPVTGDIVDPVTVDIENAITDLRNSFYTLLKFKAGVNKDMVLDENIDKAFDNLIEMMQHGSDLGNAVDALNRLHDPEGFNIHHGRIKEALEFVHKNSKVQREKIWDALQHKNDLNAFLNNLINKKIFFDPRFVKAFEDDGILPDEFVDAENMETIDHNHPKYKEVLQEIDNFERSTGKTLSGKTISEFQDEFSLNRLDKDATDKRILKQIYAQFNLDIDQFDQSVSLQEILKAVSISGFAGKYDKFLAKKLMNLVSDKIQIRFVKNATVPVRFSDTGGIVVDARFASSDYIGGTLRLESLILNGALQYLVNRQIDENEQFELQMTQLLNLAKSEYYKTSKTSILPIGLDDVRTFVAEALTNGTFQAILQNITYNGPKSTPISMWSEFKKALFDFLSKIFRINPSKNDSLLDEVINLTAHTFDKQGTSGSNMSGQGGTTGGNSQPGGVPITQQTDIKEIMALTNLVTSLQNVYTNTYLPQQQATGETPDDFETFVTTNPFAAYVIDQFNITTGRTGGGQAQTPGQSQGGSGSVSITPEIITDDAYRAFKNNEPVSDQILLDIKVAVEAGSLTPRQDEIYQAYKEAIDKAISQKSAVAITQVQLINSMLNELGNLTLADFFGNQENMPFSSGKPGDFTVVTMDGFSIIRREDMDTYLDSPIDFIFYLNGQVKADGTIIDPKPYAASATLSIPIDENTKPNVIQLINNLRVIQNKLDAIQAEVKAKLEVPVAESTTTDPAIQAQIDDIERRRPTSYIKDSKDKKSSLETFRNEAKREWDGVSVITGDRMKNLYTGIQLFVEAYPEYKELLDKFIKKENGTIGITNNNLSFVLNTLKKQGVTTENELGNKINAEYDAKIAALKAGTPTTTTTQTDTEAKKTERKERYYGSQANRMVQVQKDSENTPVTQEQIEEIEQVIEKAKELGWDKNRLFRQLSSMGYAYAFGVNPEGYRNYLEDRLSGKTNIKVTADYNFFIELDAELAALGQPATTTTDVQANRDTEMFPETSNFAQAIGDSESVLENEIKKARLVEKDEQKAQELEAELERRRSKISAYTEVNGIGMAVYTNPISGVVDVIMSGTSDNDYVGYVRLYVNDKPTNRWTSKMSNESGNKEAFKTMLSEVQSRLPVDHEYTESTNISLEGLKLYAQQLNREYEVLTDASGNPVMSSISLNAASKEGLRNAKSQKEKEDLYEPITVATREEFDKIKQEILASMPNARVSYNQANNTVNIQLPVLKKKAGPATTTTTTTTTTKEVITPEGFTNRVFESNLQLGEASADDHISEEGYNYRTLSQTEIDAIIESGGVFSREGKQRGGNKNTKYWTKGNNKNWYGDKDTTETIRVNQKNFKENEVVKAEDVEVYNKVTKQFEPLLARTTSTKTEQEKTEEEEVDEEINSNPEDNDDVKEGESKVDDASREVEQEMDEAQRRANEGKTPPFSELAKETMQSIKDALGSVRDAMKKSYSRMPQALENNYEKLRRAYKKTGGKLKEKLAKVLDSIQKYLRKLKQILIKASKTVGARRVKRGVQPNAGTPEMSSTKPQVVDNTREILADFVVEQLTQYGFVKFFAEQGMAIDANTILNLEALGTKRGDNVLLENRSTMENTLHRILHMYMDRTGPKSDKDYNAQAQSLINILRPVLQEISKAGGDPNVGVYIEKINYMFDKNPAQELVIQYLTNTPFRSFISRLSPEIQSQFQSLAKEMVLFKDSAGRVTYNKTKSFIKMQDGLLMSDALYEEFINNTLQTPLDVLGDAMASGMDPVTFLLNRIAQPIDVFIAEEASAEDLQEIADEEGKSITEVVTSIKNAVLNYLNTANFARSKTEADKAPRTKKDGIISRIIRKLKKITIGLMIALSTYTGATGFDFSGNTESEPDTEMAEKPTWSINNVVDNTMAILPISDSYKQTMYRGLIKYGIYDATAVKEEAINNEELSEAKVTVETNDTLEYVRQNTYFQNLGKARDGQGAKGDSILMYRNQWFNDVGFEYLTGASNSTRDRVGQTTYDNTVGVAHFYIMDNTGGDLSRYTTDAKFSEAKRNFSSRVGTYDIKPTDYVPVFKFMPRNETGENVVKMQFKLGSELTAEDNAITKLIQWKFGDIDFNSQADLYKASYCLTTKGGDKAYSFTFSKKANGKDLYSRFSGSSVIFIFNDQKGNTIVREFTGSINGIKKEGESIMKQFQVKPEDLTIGAFDAGSFSAKPASKNGVLKSDQWDGFNKIHPNAGSALIIPVSSTQKVIQLSDINPSEEEINNVAQEKTKSCQ
jgi:hypothetical protein